MCFCSRPSVASLTRHLLSKDGSPAFFLPYCYIGDGEHKAALFSLKDKHSVMTKKLQKTPGWFTCKPFQTDAYFSCLCNITDSVVITTPFLQKLSGYSYPANFGHIYAHEENKCPQENKTPMTNSDS